MNRTPESPLLERLRTRVLTALHTGRVAPGDRLPSVRSIADDLDVAPRTAMALYRTLAEEGLVEVRPRSGVYVAGGGEPSDRLSSETVHWVATDVAVGAWKRRIPLLDLPDFLRTCLHATGLVCACVDEIQDDRVAICREIGTDFGMNVRNVEPLQGGGVRVDDVEMSMEAALSDADLVVVTAFHERDVREVAEARDMPVVVSTLNPVGVREVLSMTEENRGLVFVVLDARAERRLREVFGDEIEVATVEGLDAGELESTDAPLCFSPAAAEAVDELPDRAVVPRAPIISARTAEMLATWMVRLSLRRAGGDVARRRF